MNENKIDEFVNVKSERQETLDKWEKIDNFINTAVIKYESIDINDVGKTAVIIDGDVVNTKYGQKVVLRLDFGKEGIKSAFVSKTLLRQWFKEHNLDKARALLGKKVKIVSVMVQTRDGMKEKAMPHLLKE